MSEESEPYLPISSIDDNINDCSFLNILYVIEFFLQENKHMQRGGGAHLVEKYFLILHGVLFLTHYLRNFGNILTINHILWNGMNKKSLFCI